MTTTLPRPHAAALAELRSPEPRAWPGPAGRAAILGLILLESNGIEATVLEVARLAGVTERTFRYRADGDYLKRLVELGAMAVVRTSVGAERVTLGPRYAR